MTNKCDAEDAELTVETADGDEMLVGNVESVELSVSATVDGEMAAESVEDEGMFASALAEDAFVTGMSMQLADDLDDILSDDDEDLPELDELSMPDVSSDVVDQLDVDAEQAEKLLKVVYQKLDAHRVEYGQLPAQMVVGLPQFKTLEAYVQSEFGVSLEQRVPVDEVIVVPGPQLHTVGDPYKMVAEDVTDETE